MGFRNGLVLDDSIGAGIFTNLFYYKPEAPAGARFRRSYHLVNKPSFRFY